MPEKKEPAEKLIDKMEAFADSLHREQEFKDFPFGSNVMTEGDFIQSPFVLRRVRQWARCSERRAMSMNDVSIPRNHASGRSPFSSAPFSFSTITSMLPCNSGYTCLFGKVVGRDTCSSVVEIEVTPTSGSIAHDHAGAGFQ